MYPKVIIAVLAFVAITLKWFPFPFIWIFVAAALASFRQVRRSSAPMIVYWFNAGGILAALAGFEIALEIIDGFESAENSGIEAYQIYEPIENQQLGYTLARNSERRAWVSLDGKPIFDVTYSVDEDGLRIAPACIGPCQDSILFFGGSFTYGEGVNDSETMPFQVGLKAQGFYKIYNFGVHGYGPQQMLALIETGKVTSTVKHPPRFAIYQALYPEHVFRVAGLRSWLRTGPRYVLDGEGDVALSGRFSDDDWPQLWLMVCQQVNKSAIGTRVMQYTRNLRSTDERLFVKVILAAAERLRSTYPGIKFDVLVWGSPPPEIVAELEAGGISLHLVDTFLRADGVPNSALWIHELNRHPSTLAHSIIADYVIRNIVTFQQYVGSPAG